MWRLVMLRCLALCGLVLLSQSGARSPTAQTLSVPVDSPRSELVALGVLTGATYFSNFEIRARPDAPWERHLPPMPAGTLTKWQISPAYDALERNLERAGVL
jgi:hypothetical protein